MTIYSGFCGGFLCGVFVMLLADFLFLTIALSNTDSKGGADDKTKN